MSEEHWPVQRLRLGIGSLLFFVMEVSAAQQLPLEFAFLIFGLALACFVSSWGAIQRFKLERQLEMIHEALASRPRTFEP